VFHYDVTLPEAVVVVNGVLQFDVTAELICDAAVDARGCDRDALVVPRGLVVCRSSFDVLDFMGSVSDTAPSPCLEEEPFSSGGASSRRPSSVTHRDSCFSPRSIVRDIVQGNPDAWSLDSTVGNVHASAAFYAWSCSHSYRHPAWPVKITEVPLSVRFLLVDLQLCDSLACLCSIHISPEALLLRLHPLTMLPCTW
jgi:hypothetical protein